MGGGGSSLAPLTAMDRPMVLEKFLGSWYVIANIPTPFEKGAYNAMETYSASKDSKHDIDISFHFNKHSFTGKHSEMKQKGWVHNQATKAEWRISPIVAGLTVPYKAPYIICDVTGSGDKYDTTIIGYPDRSYLWIMARKPELTDSEYESELNKAKEMGYDLTKINKVPQQPLDQRPAECKA